MKKTMLFVISLALAISYSCFAVDPPGMYADPAAVVVKAELPTNNGLIASEGVALFVVAASVIALVSRRTSVVVKSNFRALRKTFVALANRGVQKLPDKQGRSAQRDDVFTVANLSATT
jgi:hypothetical protein